eukprot:gene4469-6320_t
MNILNLLNLFLLFNPVLCLREFRTYSIRTVCENAKDPNFPYAYSKYSSQSLESKARVNSNLQDFRHQCGVLGGRSKCHICEEIECLSDSGVCNLQLQGVNRTDMAVNIPVVSDYAWSIGGNFRSDYGNENVTHFCVFTSGGSCIQPQSTDFSNCTIRCFGYGFNSPAKKLNASARSVVDLYPGMGKWKDDGQVDLWSYPKNCDELYANDNINCTYSGQYNNTPSYNPQGFTFTVAGSGRSGFHDGSKDDASFNFPRDLVIDESGIIYVADTSNNAIRRIDKYGTVTTIAGKGPTHSGFEDGPCSNATFSIPKGLDVRLTKQKVTNMTITTIIVADTGNHRIRRITYIHQTQSCVVECLTGLCGNNTLSATDTATQATPLTGYADGSRFEARFSAPESVVFVAGDYFVVADTGNFLLRWVVASNGSTSTLAGSVVHGELNAEGKPLAGCTPPCLQGQAGFRDGNLTYAQFYNPLDVALGPNNSVWVADEMRIRLVELPNVITDIYSIKSMGRVSTIAGTAFQGHEDGIGQESNFLYTSSLFVTKDNIAYVADAANCRIRRVTPIPLVAVKASCSSKAVDFIRPSGCTSFDQPIDKVGRKVSRVERNIQYNYGSPYESDLDRGKYIKNCVGSPPHDTLDKKFVNTSGDNLVVDDYRVAINEDSEQGMSVVIRCPVNCASSSSNKLLQGTHWYSETSNVCLAAQHDGVIHSTSVPMIGGYIQITFQRRDYLNIANLSHYINGSTRNGIESDNIPKSTTRVFSIVPFNISMSMVHTVAGHPSAPLESGCAYDDQQPSTASKFNNPSGITALHNNDGLSDRSFLFIADTNNHRIRAISATCTQICENNGTCVGPDTCKCSSGWTGIDCTKPICTSGLCGTNKVCVGPNLCACKPGYSGTNCDVPQCSQTCANNGYCSAPDTCTCASGWFDSNCTTPVCSQTCANGGNCTYPETCSCPKSWGGSDCRTPQCTQTCHNNGFCVAPDTCACPPQWTNYDCSAPVCTQGYFIPNSEVLHSKNHYKYGSSNIAQPIFKNCEIENWCNATHEFECDQSQLTQDVIALPYGPAYRAITGRKRAPNQCMNIELPLDYKIPFQLLNSDNSTTGYVRYSKYSPYTSNNQSAWRGYYFPTAGHTGPWTYAVDRQIANVQWLNVSQGVYVCANGGDCIEPNICSCAEGWIGFDCRTPVCTNGYYKSNQRKYVSGEGTLYETEKFAPYLGNNSYHLKWPYSNPNFSVEYEYYNSSNTVIRQLKYFNGTRYIQLLNSTTNEVQSYQGGYRCSIRASTKYENESFVFSHPNYYSRYMDYKKQVDNISYTTWIGFLWPPLHRKSRVLDRYWPPGTTNYSYAYANEGYRRLGIWNRTSNSWEFGVCIMEFYRNCSSDKTKQLDLESDLYDVYVQDTDLAFRPRVFYDDQRVTQRGRWKQSTGECVDEVIRGCFNNGTCVAPNTCRCAKGWSGSDCSQALCKTKCLHKGLCTFPDTCTCERGWSGADCSIPLCAQECQNGGYCVAPDVCKCKQWDNTFRDGRVAGGRPLFQDEDGSPLQSGWTGYDCATPICVQAELFVLNTVSGYKTLGGHGADGLLTCTDSEGNTQPRCPQFQASTQTNTIDNYVTANDGHTFQTGCGYDPYDTGCCVENEAANTVTCYKCKDEYVVKTNNSFYCSADYTTSTGLLKPAESSLSTYLNAFKNFKLCGSYHKPRDYDRSLSLLDYGVAKYYKSVLTPYQSNFNFRSNWTSNRFLCGVTQWEQGDYIDNAGMGSMTGVGSIYGLESGRHIRINTPNVYKDIATDTFTRQDKVYGEGIYQCYNFGSCIGPDTCTCNDGYEGYDCNTPLCRHLQPSGKVTGCLNGGICSTRDNCDCIQTLSVLYLVHPEASRGLTGWTGSDCSIPMCMQGYYDPFCSDLPQAPAGEGCYRCANKGNCTAPDVCTCAKGWTGYDCRTPVCETVADPLTRTQLGTAFEDKVISFESDPCGVEAIYGVRGWKGRKYARGNCTQPNQCTCLCKVPYDKKACSKTGRLCNGPWQDNLVAIRDLLTTRGPEYTFGSANCKYGYEGNVDSFDRFTTCHQTIYVPTSTEKQSLTLIISFSVCGFVALIFYRFVSARLKRRFLLAKIERRRSKRSSEESITKAGPGAFSNN